MKKISIIGLGLIGGSIAKALKKAKADVHISAFNRGDACKKALSDSVIDAVLNSPEEAVSSDIIFLCLPVELSLSVFDNLAPLIRENSIITDVCSVKGAFEDSWNRLNSKGIYIGGHPMTGKEKGRYDNSDPLLFENSVYILSTKNQNSPAAADLLEIMQHLGARIVFLDPYIHDRVVAHVSHIPQLLSVALVNSAAHESNGTNNIDFAAGGFRDMTRIASSDFNIWKDIIKLNHREILDAFSLIMAELGKMKVYLLEKNMEALNNMFISAAEKRNHIPQNTKGFISQLHDLFVYVKDEAGNISKISTGLFDAGINIKDMELLKIREGSGGTFRISFESKEDAIRANEILTQLGFTTD